jgi:hypothetical protein
MGTDELDDLIEELGSLAETPFEGGCCNASYPINAVQRCLTQAAAELTRLRAQVPEAVARNAARYQWLRSSHAQLETCFSDGSGGSLEMHSGEQLDEAIDKAMLSAAPTPSQAGEVQP